MKTTYCCTFWGSDTDSLQHFFSKVIAENYGGIEMPIPSNNSFKDEFIRAFSEVKEKNNDFIFIAPQLTSPGVDSVDTYISKIKNKFIELAEFNPIFINSHSGKDYYSFEDNCRVIDAAINMSQKIGIPIYHETHRGRFSFHAPTLLPYLKKFPELELVGDLSHFCAVSESLLEGQGEIIEQIIPHISHIHARVGFEQGPQVNDPRAPEWSAHLEKFIGWWQQILDYKKSINQSYFTITPEFGPAPYMPLEPYSKKPVANQWEINTFMMNTLKQKLK
jgi:hypothetical protein